MAGALETIYFNELDYIFGRISFMARSSAESYTFNPMVDMLTSDQWDEVRVKDAWYRDRIKQFFIACGKGGTIDGVRTCVQAALAVDCDLFEVWRFVDNFGLGDNLGRAPSSARNELVIRPHKASLSPVEERLTRDMLARMSPIDTIITVSTEGLAVATPVPIAGATSDSVYFEVQKIYTGSPLLDQLMDPSQFPFDLLPSEQWLLDRQPTLAPNAAFNITQEYGYHYLVGDGKRSLIDSVTYGTLQPDGSVMTEPNFEVFDSTEQLTDWFTYDLADAPDNYPGGKFGIHPDSEPALNPDRTPYRFPYTSQLAYITFKMQEVMGLGGLADLFHFKLPISAPTQTKRVFYPEYAIATDPPPRDSTVSMSLTRRRPITSFGELNDPRIWLR